MSTPFVLVVTRSFAAAPERVFDAWLDPAQARRFLFATSGGTIVRCDIDPRVGGAFTIVDRRGGEDAVHRGRFAEIDRPQRLVFLFSAAPDGDENWTRVTVEIARDPGGCTLTLTHEMDPQWAAYEAQTRRGWSTILESLDRILENAHA